MKRPAHVLVVLLVVLSASTARSTTHYVSPTGTNNWPYLDWGGAATSIQAAVDAAGVDDVIRVTNGIYQVSSMVNVMTRVRIESVNGADVTTIDGQNSYDCVALMTSGAVLDGFTLSNASMTALTTWNGATGVNCVIRGNDVQLNAGTLESCDVLDDGAGMYGAVYNGGGILRSCVIGGGGGGGGVNLESTAAVSLLTNCTLYSGAIIHGSIYLGQGWDLGSSCFTGDITSSYTPLRGSISGSGAFVLDNSLLDSCTLTPSAGGILELRPSAATFSNCTFGAASSAADSLWLTPSIYSNTLRNCTLRNGFVFTTGLICWWNLYGCQVAGTGEIQMVQVRGDFGGAGDIEMWETRLVSCTITANPGSSLNLLCSSARFTNCALGGNAASAGVLRLDTQTSGTRLDDCVLGEEVVISGTTPSGSSWELNNCNVTGQVEISGFAVVTGSLYGAGSLDVSGGRLQSCTISNLAVLSCSGGEIRSSVICDCPGRGVALWSGGLLDRCVIRNNGGGGVSCGVGTVRNCEIVSNASSIGGGVYCDPGSVVESCTIVGNSAGGGGGGGVFCNSGALLRNCVIYGNSSASGSNWYNSGEGMTYDHDATAPDPGGTGHVLDDPQFVDPGAGDYRLAAVSPCINAGTNQSWMTNATDLAGSPRIVNEIVDMGAYEFIYSPTDYDGDGLSNTLETTLYSTDPTDADSDEDGQNDGDEVAAGMNPNDSNSFFAIDEEDRAWTAGGIVISWPSASNRTYAVDRATNLVEGFGAPLAEDIEATYPVNTFTDTTATAAGPYIYRISVE